MNASRRSFPFGSFVMTLACLILGMVLTADVSRTLDRHIRFNRQCRLPIQAALSSNDPREGGQALDRVTSYLEQRAQHNHVYLDPSRQEEVRHWRSALHNARAEFALAEHTSDPQERRMILIRAHQLLSTPAPSAASLSSQDGPDFGLWMYAVFAVLCVITANSFPFTKKE